MNDDSPRAIRDALSEAGPRKRWGQNFMVNRGARAAILAMVDARPGLRVWEVGGGLGAMTEPLVRSGASVTVFEVDPDLADYLQRRVDGPGELEIVRGDVMETWRAHHERAGSPQVLFGNLPYGIAQRLLVDMVIDGLRPERVVCTVQKEVAERAVAAPGGRTYSAFTVFLGLVFRVRMGMSLAPGSFWPAPEVSSAVLHMELRPDAPPTISRGLTRLVRLLFSSRRKTIRSNLRSLESDTDRIEKVLETLGISPAARAETLPPDVFASLAGALGADGLL